MQLPAYQIPRNALLDLSPINDAIDTGIRVKQQGVENDFRRQDLDMRKQEFASNQADRADARMERFKAASAGVAQMILEDKDPNRASQAWSKLISSDPRWTQALTTAGVDPNDYKAGASTIIAQVRGYRDPTETALKQAQLENARGTNAVQAAQLAQFKNQTPEARARMAPTYGLQPGTTAYNNFVLTGQYAPDTPKIGTLKDGEQLYTINKAGDGINFIPGPQGAAPSDSALKREAELRKEFSAQPTVKDFQTVRDAYTNVKQSAAGQSPASDISMIFAYMKLLDPTSVVREGEFATAQNAAGVPTQVYNLYNRMLSGERLSPGQRTDFLKSADSIYQGRERQYQGVVSEFRRLATGSGARPEQIVIDHSVREAPPPAPGRQPPPGQQPPPPPRQRAVNPSTGQIIEWDGTQWIEVR